MNNVQPGTSMAAVQGNSMEATPGQKIAPSVSHETCVIAGRAFQRYHRRPFVAPRGNFLHIDVLQLLLQELLNWG